MNPIDNLDAEAKAALTRAFGLLRDNDARQLDAEHLLLGILQQPAIQVTDILRKMALDPKLLASAVSSYLPDLQARTPANAPFISPRLEMALKAALNEAGGAGTLKTAIAQRHLLLALLADPADHLTKTLADSGLTRAALQKVLAPVAPMPPSATVPTPVEPVPPAASASTPVEAPVTPVSSATSSDQISPTPVSHVPTAPTPPAETPTVTVDAPTETTTDPSPLSHINEQGRARMVDVSDKAVTSRRAVARGQVVMLPATLQLIQDGKAAKGDVLAVAQVAGIMAAKKTSELIPMCHPLPITGVNISFSYDVAANALLIEAEVKVSGVTGVEMEALTAVSVAALTVYDMVKAVDKTIEIGAIRLISKSGGKSGDFSAPRTR